MNDQNLLMRCPSPACGWEGPESETIPEAVEPARQGDALYLFAPGKFCPECGEQVEYQESAERNEEPAGEVVEHRLAAMEVM